MGLIEQYTAEIERMKMDLSTAQSQLAYYKEQKRLARPTARGRIAHDNWGARLGDAQYDIKIAATNCKIAFLKNQIKLRQEAIKQEKANTKKAKGATQKKATKTTKTKTTLQPTKSKSTSSSVKKTTKIASKRTISTTAKAKKTVKESSATKSKSGTAKLHKSGLSKKK